MLTTLLIMLLLVTVGLAMAAGWLFATEHVETCQARARAVAEQERLAEWRIQQVASTAFGQMLDEARRSG
jgi:hypothetical protein